MSIPFELKQVIESGNAILFVGAGIGFNMKSNTGKHAPTGSQLAEILSLQFDVPSSGITDLAKISQFIVAQKGGKQELNTFLRDFLDDFGPDEFMLWIPTIRWKAIFTTNYDRCIQKAYDNCSEPAQQYITVTHLSGLPAHVPFQEVPIIHLHGSLFSDRSPDILITQQD